MAGRVREIDHGYREFRRNMERIDGSYTKVGVLSGSKAEDGVSDLVAVAVANEFGTETKSGEEHVPERSFMRSTFDESQAEIQTIKAAEIRAIHDGRKDARQALQQIGEWFAGKIQAKIHSHPPPPNAPSTIKRKRSTGTLVDSGTMAQSIRHVEIMGGRK